MARFIKVARENIELKNYRGLLAGWSDSAVRTAEHGAKGKYARAQWKGFASDQFVKTWIDGEREQQKGRQSRDWLLKQKLTRRQRTIVLARQGGSWRSHSGERDRHKSIPYFEEAARLNPSELDHANRWLEAANHYGEPRAAAEHMLKIRPAGNHYHWRNLLHAAEKLQDKALAKRAHKWITDSQPAPSLDYANEIGDRLFKLGLESEARSYWQTRIAVNRDHGESQHCAGKLHNSLPENQRETFIKKLMGPDSDHHGAYACWPRPPLFRTRRYRQVHDHDQRSATPPGCAARFAAGTPAIGTHRPG